MSKNKSGPVFCKIKTFRHCAGAASALWHIWADGVMDVTCVREAVINVHFGACVPSSLETSCTELTWCHVLRDSVAADAAAAAAAAADDSDVADTVHSYQRITVLSLAARVDWYFCRWCDKYSNKQRMYELRGQFHNNRTENYYWVLFIYLFIFLSSFLYFFIYLLCQLAATHTDAENTEIQKHTDMHENLNIKLTRRKNT